MAPALARGSLHRWADDQVLAPFTLSTEELVRVADCNGGARNVAAWRDHITPLVEQRMSYCEQGRLKQALALPAGPLCRDQVMRILAVGGGRAIWRRRLSTSSR